MIGTLIRSHSTDSLDHLLPNKGEGEDRACSPRVAANGHQSSRWNHVVERLAHRRGRPSVTLSPRRGEGRVRGEAVRVVLKSSGARFPGNRGLQNGIETLIWSHSTNSRDHLLPNKGEGEDRASSPIVPAKRYQISRSCSCSNHLVERLAHRRWRPSVTLSPKPPKRGAGGEGRVRGSPRPQPNLKKTL